MAATGSMRCEVKSNDVIVMEEGSANKYNGYTNGFKVGDALLLKYNANTAGVTVALENQSNPNAIPRIFVTINKSDVGFTSSDVRANEYNSEGGIVRTGPRDYISVYNDSLTFSNLLYRAELERYYKSDWHGLVHSVLGLDAHIMGISCTHNNNELEDLINTIKSY